MDNTTAVEKTEQFFDNENIEFGRAQNSECDFFVQTERSDSPFKVYCIEAETLQDIPETLESRNLTTGYVFVYIHHDDELLGAGAGSFKSIHTAAFEVPTETASF